jgi:3-oxoacyl-[acyl-carrier-protein] synthase-3
LSLADGLIRTGTVNRILFIAAETYTKMIDAGDRSLRTIFGDGGTATLIQPSDEPSMWGFKYGTDGSGADTLIASCGGFRKGEQALRPRHRKRWNSDLYMDGPSLISFTVGKIPDLVASILAAANVSADQIEYYLFHQATSKMLEQLQKTLGVDPRRMPIRIENLGNTVSCTLPILIQQMRESGELNRSSKNLLIGFGVGWSWAGCVWQDTLGQSR